jgi:hypothetical protein
MQQMTLSNKPAIGVNITCHTLTQYVGDPMTFYNAEKSGKDGF